MQLPVFFVGGVERIVAVAVFTFNLCCCLYVLFVLTKSKDRNKGQ
jgi:hypothetical protein